MPDIAIAARPANTALAEQLAVITERWPAAQPAMVAEVVQSVLATMRGDLTSVEAALLHEVAELGRTITTARAEIAALQVDDITASHIPSATDELDAIVGHTAAATESILEVCEMLDGMAATLDAAGAQALQDATTRIYEACSFQDITGQRITKVVATLKAIDSKVGHIIATFERKGAGATPPRPPPADISLLNGPQLPASAMDQHDIDKLLASFD
ncbi:MAG: protein phosphatase CheZ [Acetobacteraceae bacterium]|nr:protein phosphatase CheZ [Acetobacteraceae bacterium]